MPYTLESIRGDEKAKEQISKHIDDVIEKCKQQLRKEQDESALNEFSQLLHGYVALRKLIA